MNNTNQFPSFDELSSKKEVGELIQTLKDNGLKFPKDNYYIKSLIDETDSRYGVLYIIGEKHALRLISNYSFQTFLIMEDEKPNIEDIKQGIYRDFSTWHNLAGPAIVDLFPQALGHYYINGKLLTKKQFIAHRTNQRIKLING